MGAPARVQINRDRYERTSDVGIMLTSGQLAAVIKREAKRILEKQDPETNIFDVVPARAATSMEYKSGQEKAVVWNEGSYKDRKEIPFPLEDGWRTSDGNEFGVPNGPKTNKNNPEALYLVRKQTGDFSGPVGLAVDVYWGRGFVADVGWSDLSGVALIGREATAPLVTLPAEKLIGITNPKDLLERATHLESVARDLSERFKGFEGTETYTNLVTKTIEDAQTLRDLAEKLASIQPKA